MSERAQSVGEDIQLEIKRVRDVVLPAYDAIGPPGLLAATMIRQTLDRATKALAEGNVIEIVLAYADLREYHE